MSLHPQAQALLEATRDAPPMSVSTVAQARATMAQIGVMVGAGPEVSAVHELAIGSGGRTIAARRYVPAGRPPGVIVYLHGGGWVIGSLDDFDAVARTLAVESGCEVVAVDYALAPEHPFPAAPDDASAATAWVAEHISASRPLVVLGDSAGATLAAVTARRARDRGGPQIALQVLLYPPVDCDFSRGSYTEMGDGSYLNSTADMQWFWDHYVPDRHRRRDPDAAPLHAEDFTGLPPAIVMVCEYDILRDEGLAYAEAMQQAGVPVKLIHVPDQIHAFWNLVNLLESADHYVAVIGGLVADAVAAGTR